MSWSPRRRRSWSAGGDGFVGYRVRERLGSISAPNDVVGRSSAVTGTVTIAGGSITGARVDVDMTGLRTDIEPRDQRMREDGLETIRSPARTRRCSRRVSTSCCDRAEPGRIP